MNFFSNYSKLQDSRFYFKSAGSWSSTKHVENFGFAVFNDSDGTSRFNFTGSLLVDLGRLMLTFDLKKKTSLDAKDYEIDVYHGNVDSCNVAKGMVGNYLINFILAGLKEYSNFVIECPLRKGFYYITNFPVPKQVQDFIPKFIPQPSQNSAWVLTITARAKIQKGATFRVFLMKIHGLTVLND